MNVASINLNERVLPWVPIRQWVLTVPHPLRFLMASDHEVTLEVGREVRRAIASFLRKQAKRRGIKNCETGSVTFVQRFNSGLGCSIHFHILFLDGVYQTYPGCDKRPVFINTPPFTDQDLLNVLQKVCNKVVTRLLKSGYLEPETLEPSLPDGKSMFDESDVLAVIRSASIKSRIAFGIRSGQKVRRVGARDFGVGIDVDREIISEKCVRVGRFTLHANTRVATDKRDQLESLIKYVARPAVSHDRISLTPSGDIEYTLKSEWHDGTTALLFSPEEFIEKLAALVPYPQKNLIIYSGCLAANHKIRSQIIPLQPPPETMDQAKDASKPQREGRYIPWAELLKKTWNIDIFKCEKCNGPTRIGEFISDPDEILKVMTDAGLSARPPPDVKVTAVIYEQTDDLEPFPNDDAFDS